MVVTGRQPGPGLWRVSKGEHEMLVLGTLSPLPAKMQLQTQEIAQTIARSQEVIRAPYITAGSDIGKFKALMLLPSLIGIKNNPDRKTLRDVMPSTLYARWQPFKQRFLGDDRDVERMRPLFASQELYRAAIKRSGMDHADPTAAAVTQAIEQHHPNVTVVKLELKIKDPRAAIRQVKAMQMDDLACMERTLDRLGVDMEVLRLRANAWATGDVATLQANPVPNQYEVCMAAVSESAVGRQIGMADAQARLRGMWLDKAQAALARNATTFAILPMGEMLKPGGYLDALRGLGYEVEAPY